MELEHYEGAEWLSRNLVPQYWRGEKLELETGRYLASQLNKDWYDVEKFKLSVPPSLPPPPPPHTHTHTFHFHPPKEKER